LLAPARSYVLAQGGDPLEPPMRAAPAVRRSPNSLPPQILLTFRRLT
jgi:hypothetical protein